MTNTTIKTAVFPVAGWGTRFLPATKASPKEMLPIVDKPLIQYAVEEAVKSGIKQMVFVTSSNKRSIEDHFDSNFELEELLRRTNKLDFLNLVENVLPKSVSCVYVRQPEMRGLGHAVLCAKDIVGQAPFAVLLADDLIDNDASPCLKQLIDVFKKEKGSVVAVEKVAQADVKKYGIVDMEKNIQHYFKLKGIVEKPSPEKAPSHFGVVGRYVLSSRIFKLLEQVTPGAIGEIQLTDAIAKLMTEESIFALPFKGRRFDCGNKLGYLEATVQYALKHSEVVDDFIKVIKNLDI